MNKKAITRLETDPVLARRLLIAAQIIALLAYVMGLLFLRRTTGGTLFLFSTIAPLLVAVAIVFVVGVIAYKFRRRHSLFFFETFAPGEIVFRQGDEGDCAYFIHSGELEVVQHSGAGDRVIARLSPGQYFGEMALITSEPRNATVRAVSPTRLAVLGKENFLTMVSLIPSTKQDIMKTVHERAMQHAGE
jgi:hypothetical protein